MDSVVPSHWSLVQHSLTAIMSDKVHKELPTRKAQGLVSVQRFYWNLVIQLWLTAHVVGLLSPAPQVD